MHPDNFKTHSESLQFLLFLVSDINNCTKLILQLIISSDILEKD
jgi:hypothetical protein